MIGSLARKAAPVTVLLLLAVTPALAQDPPAGSPPTATVDEWSLVPTLQTQIPVLANDADPDGEALRIVSHTDPARGSVSCDETTCTYVPPVRELPSDDSDALLAPEQPDSFTYTVADPTDQQASAEVHLAPIVPRQHTRRVRAAGRRCGKLHTSQSVPSQSAPSPSTGGGAITYGRAHTASRCPAHKQPASSDEPSSTPVVGTPGSRAVDAASPWVSGLRYGCAFRDVGSQGIGQFSIRSWIGENGSTGTNRMTIGYRVQIHGTNFYGQSKWVTVNGARISANTDVPDSYNSWLPANRDFTWLRIPWGNASYAVQHGPFRLQIRTQWIKRHFYGDDVIKQYGWGTLRGCEGQPSLE